MFLTLSETINPTKNGPKIDEIFPKLLVIPINVPAKFGAKSIWLVKKPVYTPLFRLKAAVNRNNASTTEVSNR